MAGTDAAVEKLVADGIGVVLCTRGFGSGFAFFGAMGHVVEGDSDLNADRGVILLETEVVVLDVGVLGKTAVLSLEVNLGSPKVAGVAEGSLALGAGDGVGGFDGRAGERSGVGEIGRGDGEGRDTAAGGAESLRRKTDEAREMGLVGGGLVFGAEAGQANLRGGETAGGEIDGSVLASVEALLNDADETIGEALLLLKCGLALQVTIECEVGDGSVLCYSSADVLEVEAGGIEGGLRGAEVVVLRVAEDQRLRGDIEDRGLA